MPNTPYWKVKEERCRLNQSLNWKPFLPKKQRKNIQESPPSNKPYLDGRGPLLGLFRNSILSFFLEPWPRGVAGIHRRLAGKPEHLYINLKWKIELANELDINFMQSTISLDCVREFFSPWTWSQTILL